VAVSERSVASVLVCGCFNGGNQIIGRRAQGREEESSSPESLDRIVVGEWAEREVVGRTKGIDYRKRPMRFWGKK
jgi:hypothetical protein